jgi:signal transduction histidine kinase
MKWSRWMEQPRLLAMLALAFALVPVWLAVITYRDARQKDERLFETTAQVLLGQLQNDVQRTSYFLGVMRNQARSLSDEAMSKGQMQSPNFDWKGMLPHLTAFGYVDSDWGNGLPLRWISEQRAPVAKIGDNIASDARVEAEWKGASARGMALKKAGLPSRTDHVENIGCVVDHHRLIELLCVIKNPPPGARGYMVGWLDMDLICSNPLLPLVRDKVLTATVLEAAAPTPTGAKRMKIVDGDVMCDVAIARGATFSTEYTPAPWLAFVAVGISAVPLLILSVLAGRAAKLRGALAAERELVRQQRFFTQSVSHEFRTPLGIILSGADLLDSYMDQLTPERRSEVLREIKDNTRHMNAMIEQVLLLGRIESSRLECNPKPVDIAGLCQEVVGKVSTATQNRCPIKVSAPDHEALLDPAVLGSVIGNLLSNAVKYSAPGSPVTLEANVKGGWLNFIVSDQGIGIPPEDVSRVGELFHRSGNVGDTPGSGLGLTIAHRCTELLGGTLKIDSKEGEGTTATVQLPNITIPP